MNGPGLARHPAPDWPGARNLRDLGGRPLAGGGSTPYGRVFRSGAREYLTDDGWRAARAAGVRTVVDLRNAPEETRSGPDHPVVSPASLEGVMMIATPTEDPADADFLAVCGPWLDHPRSWGDNARLAPDRIGRALAAIADAGPGVLVHCAGGRDRTGMVCAMLLQLAGAGTEAICADYADGWRGAAAYAGHFWAYDAARQRWEHGHHPAPDPADVETRLAERLPVVAEWTRTFDTAGYLRSVGLTGAQLSALSELLRP